MSLHLSPTSRDSLWTLHVNPQAQESDPQIGTGDLVKSLYRHALHEDPLFHFFYEPDLIIRTSLLSVREKIEQWLKDRNYTFIIYDYPTPKPIFGQILYGENGFVEEHLDLFLEIFHTHSLAAVEMDGDEHGFYMTHVIDKLLSDETRLIESKSRTLEYLASRKLTDFSPNEIPMILQTVASTVESRIIAKHHLGLIDRVHTVAHQRIKEQLYYQCYVERVIHAMFNAANHTHNEESIYLSDLSRCYAQKGKIAKSEHNALKEIHLPLQFQHQDIMAEPKRPVRAYGDYHILHNNGFIKLATMAGRVYWVKQAEQANRNPDWKIHFSIQEESLPMAWNTLAQLFIEQKCKFGMKMCYVRFSEHMRGREITVYIFQYHESYANNGFFTAEDEQSVDFWKNFIKIAEERLQQRGVKSNGTAVGDKPLGVYASLRNEAFVPFQEGWFIPSSGLPGLDPTQKLEGQFVYPPNEAGYNGAKQKDPFSKIHSNSSLSSWINHLLSHTLRGDSFENVQRNSKRNHRVVSVILVSSLIFFVGSILVRKQQLK